ncbi:peptidase A4 family-domain-containing protein [Amanita rubescens]|nr:peptidase A4 family-domain-containing protein [Amanita rubescens]
MFRTSLLTSILLATVAIAAPSSTIGARHRSQPLQRIQNSDLTTDGTQRVFLSHNWAGSIQNSTKGTFTTVTGTFVVPTPSAPEGFSSVWVGIDGFTCPTKALLQTGVQLNLVNDTVSYQAWYEWFPADTIYFDNITINSGDEVRLTVVATSTTTGKALVENLTNKQTVEHDLSSSYPLCQESAEWIVEDFSFANESLVPFNDFGTVIFTDAFALTAGGEILTPDGAIITLIAQNNETITSVDEGLLGVTISYNKTQ